MKITRRDILKFSAATGAAFTLGPHRLFAQSNSIILKKIPSSGEAVPVIGIGTNRYGVGTSEEERAPLRATLQKFSEMGGKVIDTAPVYRTSEAVLGDLISGLGIRDRLFLATKTDMMGQVHGGDSYQASMDRLKTGRLDVMMVHNLRNAENELAAMREWQQDGRIKYIGITTSRTAQFADMEKLMNNEKMDFVQLNYSLGDREAAKKLLPVAAEKGIAVMVNVPFGGRGGGLFDRTRGQELPDWAAEYGCKSWAQFFLKYIVSYPSVTCTIPGTTKVRHAEDNFGAAMGELPDADFRKRQEQFFDSI